MVPETVALTFVFVIVEPPEDPNLIICKSLLALDKFCMSWLYLRVAELKSCSEIISFS